jgi:putative aminopeptidase FrvX
MPDQDFQQLLQQLSDAPGPPGAEDEIRRIVRRTLEGAGSIHYDRLGSLICEQPGTSETPRVVLDSHLDEVAFMVQAISDAGRMPFVPLGGWWSHVLLAQPVEIITEQGPVPGVVGSTPPHHLSAAQREKLLPIEQMYIDVGASDRAEVEALGIRLGDPIVPQTKFREMAVEGVVAGKAMDNRVGVCLMCDALLALSKREHANRVIGVGAVQEELGLRGAGTTTELTRPDVAIVLECAPADDLPGESQPQGVLGKGPQVRLFDPTAVANRRLVRFVEEVADECGLPIQPAVRRAGGTDAGAIHKSGQGVPTVVVAVPARYIHSHISLLQWADYRTAAKLVLELVLRLDADRVASFTRFDT